jgi:AcrR family transcriptional regulator
VTVSERRRGRPTGGHLDVDVDVVLDAAERVIAEEGRAASIDAIAAAAGITKPSVYARVGDRASLSDALAGRLVARLMAEAGPAVADGLDRDRLAALFTRSLEVLERDRELFFFVTRGASADAGERTLHLAHRSAEPLVLLLAQWRAGHGRDPSVALPWAYGIIGMLNMVALWWLDDGGSDAATVAADLADLVWSGVGDV